jgi:NADPH2:quinone reductase
MFQVGDKVLVHTGNHGLFQEKLKVQSCFCTALPPEIGLQEALVLCINYLTAYFSLLKVGNLKEGESVLLTSAGGK